MRSDETRFLTHKGLKKHVRAKWKLFIPSIICFIFVTAEVTDPFVLYSCHAARGRLSVDLKKPRRFPFLISGCDAAGDLGKAVFAPGCIWALLLSRMRRVALVLTVRVTTGGPVYLACELLLRPDFQIRAAAMLITSGGGVLVDLILTLHRRRHGHNHRTKTRGHLSGQKPAQSNANVRIVFAHATGDLFQSASVLVSALIILFKPDYEIADPICTFVFSILALATTTATLRDILLLLMEGRNVIQNLIFLEEMLAGEQTLELPRDAMVGILFINSSSESLQNIHQMHLPSSPGASVGLDYNAGRESILAVQGMGAVQSLRLWSLTMNQVILSAQAAAADTPDSQLILKGIPEAPSIRFACHSITIHLESKANQKSDCIFCQDPED
ncbi:LOW QUALITY PROTEIN: zinc transporter 8 [Ornithorhynchus anatinus]|uniref:LOW QUALITY PROTEIN: zinc transporter 8 n=1 Tax=Ornithorhynchus anatinus TaxID=9258 RepID=UPI0010A76D19|nr:LOW QUALITY PROTEIN: zinc transporter 8 [Ornithorhynchus anatinus]